MELLRHFTGLSLSFCGQFRRGRLLNLVGLGLIAFALLLNAAPASGAAASTNAPVGTNVVASGTNALLVSRRLQPNDVLQVSIYQQPDLDVKVTIDNRGMVMLPLLGPVKLGGLNLEEATTLVKNLYDADYLVNPKVTIQVGQMATMRFTILGQVQRPGTYDFPPNEKLNLVDGIAMAGGYTRLANSGNVTLQRNVEGKLKIFNFNADEMARDHKRDPFQLQPGDIITVGERVF